MIMKIHMNGLESFSEGNGDIKSCMTLYFNLDSAYMFPGHDSSSHSQ